MFDFFETTHITPNYGILYLHGLCPPEKIKDVNARMVDTIKDDININTATKGKVNPIIENIDFSSLLQDNKGWIENFNMGDDVYDEFINIDSELNISSKRNNNKSSSFYNSGVYKWIKSNFTHTLLNQALGYHAKPTHRLAVFLDIADSIRRIASQLPDPENTPFAIISYSMGTSISVEFLAEYKWYIDHINHPHSNNFQQVIDRMGPKAESLLSNIQLLYTIGSPLCWQFPHRPVHRYLPDELEWYNLFYKADILALPLHDQGYSNSVKDIELPAIDLVESMKNIIYYGGFKSQWTSISWLTRVMTDNLTAIMRYSPASHILYTHDHRVYNTFSTLLGRSFDEGIKDKGFSKLVCKKSKLIIDTSEITLNKNDLQLTNLFGYVSNPLHNIHKHVTKKYEVPARFVNLGWFKEQFANLEYCNENNIKPHIVLYMHGPEIGSRFAKEISLVSRMVQNMQTDKNKYLLCFPDYSSTGENTFSKRAAYFLKAGYDNKGNYVGYTKTDYQSSYNGPFSIRSLKDLDPNSMELRFNIWDPRTYFQYGSIRKEILMGASMTMGIVTENVIGNSVIEGLENTLRTVDNITLNMGLKDVPLTVISYSIGSAIIGSYFGKLHDQNIYQPEFIKNVYFDKLISLGQHLVWVFDKNVIKYPNKTNLSSFYDSSVNAQTSQHFDDLGMVTDYDVDHDSIDCNESVYGTSEDSGIDNLNRNIAHTDHVTINVDSQLSKDEKTLRSNTPRPDSGYISSSSFITQKTSSLPPLSPTPSSNSDFTNHPINLKLGPSPLSPPKTPTGPSMPIEPQVGPRNKPFEWINIHYTTDIFSHHLPEGASKLISLAPTGRTISCTTNTRGKTEVIIENKGHLPVNLHDIVRPWKWNTIRHQITESLAAALAPITLRYLSDERIWSLVKVCSDSTIQ